MQMKPNENSNERFERSVVFFSGNASETFLKQIRNICWSV
jgi:hypothetical protein